MSQVIVIGAGLQGVCAALALRDAGHQVTVVDQASQPMTRASLRNEGKIHLGFTYSNEPSLSTAVQCLETALEFADLIDGWLPERIDWRALRSRPFTYLVMADSLLSAESIASVYDRLQADFVSLGRPPYLGTTIDDFVSEVPVPAFVSADHVVAAFETAEVALDLAEFRRALTVGFSDKVRWLPQRRVDGVSEISTGFEVSGRFDDGTRWRERADAVVNCSWEGRATIDKQVGLLPESPLSYRLKYRVLAQLPDELSRMPALTMVLGPFGDIVPNRPAYLSWYPASRVAWSAGIGPPVAWEPLLAQPASGELAASISAAVLAALDERVPGVSASRVVAVDAGVVVASGASDIDDADSALHSRRNAGVFGKDGYLSVDTGKLGFAPHFAAELAGKL